MDLTRTAPGPVGAPVPAAVVIDLDHVRLVRSVASSRLARLAGLQAQDVGRTVRVQALERLSRR